MNYLSVDLDYWFRPQDCSGQEFDYLFRLLELVGDIPDKVIVQEHQNILHHINACQPQRIFHIDYHQDIAFPTFCGENVPLNCGTFFYFVKGRQQMEFTWFYPEHYACIEEGEGLCVDEDLISPFDRENFIFKEQNHQQGLPDLSMLTNISGVGIALSQDFCSFRDGKRGIAARALRKLYEIFGTDIIRPLLRPFQVEGFWVP